MTKGGCLCGAVRFSISGEPVVQLFCYCTDCRQVSGTDGYAAYVVQRADCEAFKLAGDIDPTYAEAFATARAGGVEALCYSCKLDAKGIRLDRPLPIVQ